ncbi:DNA-3-methyladenine glycosylase family protein [Peribacillus kribbensis]|uniref:DNA-3-methyladenine glycosylase family protein n=1 Tax=Peribacillus kribbensis TaxID=356658 RepID=UPI0004013C7F|nr:DNA-3-methyladenine glycosylase [Peribacillus kribbensis]
MIGGRDFGAYVEIDPPNEFNAEECLVFLRRSDLESTHHVIGSEIYKGIKLSGEKLALKIRLEDNRIRIGFLPDPPSAEWRRKAALFVREWLDLDRDLSVFYEAASKDSLLERIVPRYYGLRLIGIPDLFEALTWAVIGQQINLKFAYTLKKRFVEFFGESIETEEGSFRLFPEPGRIEALQPEELRPLQFTWRKAEYVIGIAKAVVERKISKHGLQALPQEKARAQLLELKGVGAWTADYTAMKCLRDTTAFPAADAGLHQALKRELEMDRKPKPEELQQLQQEWAPFQAYAVFYLWRSLL